MLQSLHRTWHQMLLACPTAYVVDERKTRVDHCLHVFSASNFIIVQYMATNYITWLRHTTESDTTSHSSFNIGRAAEPACSSLYTGTIAYLCTDYIADLRTS